MPAKTSDMPSAIALIGMPEVLELMIVFGLQRLDSRQQVALDLELFHTASMTQSTPETFSRSSLKLPVL